MEALHDWVMSQGDTIVLWLFLAVFAVIAVVTRLTGVFTRAWNALRRSAPRYIRIAYWVCMFIAIMMAIYLFITLT